MDSENTSSSFPRSFGATNCLPGVITAVFTKEIPRDVVRALMLCIYLLFHLAALQTLLGLRNSSGRAVLQPDIRTITARCLILSSPINSIRQTAQT